MRLFGQDYGNYERLGPSRMVGTGSRPPASAANGAPASHRLTMDLARAESLAIMLAGSRAAKAVEVADLLAGMYIYSWERLSKYWEEHAAIESYLQMICRISPQRWHRWIQFYDKQRRAEERARNQWRPLSLLKKEKPAGKALARSAALESILKKAQEIAPFHDTLAEHVIPILTSECVLLSMARSSESEIGQKLILTGLDVAKLEQDIHNPKHGPLR